MVNGFPGGPKKKEVQEAAFPAYSQSIFTGAFRYLISFVSGISLLFHEHYPRPAV